MRRTYLEWDRLSVYNYKEENIQEMIVNIYSIIEDLKANGQVVPPDLIPSVEKLKEEMIEIKHQMSVEVQTKIDKAIQDLTNVVNEKVATLDSKFRQVGIAYPQGNKITDPLINDYVQQLTLGDNFENLPSGYYGKTTMYVKNGTGHIKGSVNIKEGFEGSDKSEDDLLIVKPWIAMKQFRNTSIPSTIWSSGYDRCNQALLELKNNGKLVMDTGVWNRYLHDKDANTCLSLDISFPILKQYPYKDDHSNYIDACIKVVRDASNEMTSNIVLASDTHLNAYYSYETNTIGNYDIYMPTLLNYANTKLGAFATIINGDVLTEMEGVNTISDIEWLMHDTRRQFIDNTIFVLGNHDDMSLLKSVEQPTDKRKYQEYMNGGKTGINFSANSEPYFYTDDTVGQCRHIILNSHDVYGKKIHAFKFGEEQIKWLAYALETTPKNYSIVVYCHVSPRESKDMIKDGGNYMINGDAVHSVLVAYKERNKGQIPLSEGNAITVDFRACEGYIAGCISGHEHEDYHKVTGGINYIIDDTGRNKDSFTLLSVDGKNRRLRFKRLAFNGGARQDLELSY